MSTFNELSYGSLFQIVVGRSETNLLQDDELKRLFASSRILIVGAGGSIGSALAQRLISANIHNVYLLDRDESALHALALKLSDIAASLSDKSFIADIRDRQSVREVIEFVRPTLVIHAAALKHLVMLERFPREGYLTNLIGTLNIAQLCVELGVKQFVNISTDKAANPISVLGRTKKLAELIVEEIYLNSELKQCSVRFGNVFASRGSVIETFVHQINNGLPVTITDSQVARYFMSRDEAANLVLAAASLDESGTYIQNMGDEVAILDVVQRLGKALGLAPKVIFFGLQSGEKLHEELYDAPTSRTTFGSISRSVHSIERGLLAEVVQRQPSSSSEAIEMLNLLTSKYIKVN